MKNWDSWENDICGNDNDGSDDGDDHGGSHSNNHHISNFRDFGGFEDDFDNFDKFINEGIHGNFSRQPDQQDDDKNFKQFQLNY